MRRLLLGRASGAVSRQRVYRVADGLEVDDIDHYEVNRRRVFFDQVTAITYHTQRGWVVALVLGVIAVAFLAIAAMFASDEGGAAVAFGAVAALFAVPALLKLIVPAHVVTVFGRRTKAVMQFAFRHQRARRVFGELVAEVEARQQAVRSEADARLTAPVQEFPLPEDPA